MKPLTPPPIAEREKHFKNKIAQQKPLPPGTPPMPEWMPRIVNDPLKGSK
jgi:hypothetical protein